MLKFENVSPRISRARVIRSRCGADMDLGPPSRAVVRQDIVDGVVGDENARAACVTPPQKR
jgi:hypothetical protein